MPVQELNANVDSPKIRHSTLPSQTLEYKQP